MTDSFPTRPGPEGSPDESKLTIETVRGICCDIAEDDERFGDHRVPRSRTAYSWETDDNVSYDVSLTAWHSFREDWQETEAEAEYLGQGYELGMSISYEINPREPARELLDYLSHQGRELPDGIEVITVTYSLELETDPANQLGWDEYRFYDIEYRAETIDGFPPEETMIEGTTFATTSEHIGIEVSRLSHMRVALQLGSHSLEAAGDAVSDLSEMSDDMFQSLIERLIDSCQADPDSRYLDLAATILEMIKFRDEGSFDLTKAFPEDVIEMIHAAEE